MAFGAYYGPLETWKIVYNPPVGSPLRDAGGYGVAFVELIVGSRQYIIFRNSIADNIQR